MCSLLRAYLVNWYPASFARYLCYITNVNSKLNSWNIRNNHVPYLENCIAVVYGRLLLLHVLQCQQIKSRDLLGLRSYAEETCYESLSCSEFRNLQATQQMYSVVVHVPGPFYNKWYQQSLSSMCESTHLLHIRLPPHYASILPLGNC